MCILFGMSKEKVAEAQKSEVLQGTLDLMALKVLVALGTRRGCGRKQLARETGHYERIDVVIGRLLRPEGQE